MLTGGVTAGVLMAFALILAVAGWSFGAEIDQHQQDERFENKDAKLQTDVTQAWENLIRMEQTVPAEDLRPAVQ